MSNPKDHHYVPRCFFKPWADDVQRVVVYERKDGKILLPYRQSTKSICVQAGLYSYSDSVEEVKRNVIEQELFSKIDTNAARILRKLYLIDGSVDLSEEDRYSFSVFLMSLRVRTPESFRTNAQKAHSQLRSELIRNDPRLEDEDVKIQLKGKTLLSWVEENNLAILENYGRELLAKFIVDPKFVIPIFQTTWMTRFVKNSTQNLITSDRPLVFLGNRGDGNFALGLAIAPDRVFLAAERPETIHKLRHYPMDKIVTQMNINTVEQAERKAFASDTSHATRFFQNRLGVRHNTLPWVHEAASVGEKGSE